MLKKNILLLLPCLLIACSSSGFNRSALRDHAGIIPKAAKESDIQEALDRQANLPKPFSVAIYFKTPKTSRWKGKQWHWTQDDKQQVIDAFTTLKKEGLVSNVFPIISSMVERENMHNIRLAAAKHGADAVVVINGIADTDRYFNPLGITYWLVLPAFIVPGSEVEALFLTNASMWDVRNEYLYVTAEAEGYFKNSYAALFSERDIDVIQVAKSQGIEQLRNELEKMLSKKNSD